MTQMDDGRPMARPSSSVPARQQIGRSQQPLPAPAMRPTALRW